MDAPPSGFRPTLVEEVKGRRKRERKFGAVAIRRGSVMAIASRRFWKGFRLFENLRFSGEGFMRKKILN